MNLPLMFQGVGSTGLFAGRAFVPAFATAALLRLGPHLPGPLRFGLLQHARGVPTWFTSDAALVVLGLLAALELLAGRWPEAKAALDEVHDYLKAAMAALTYLGVLSTTEGAAVGRLIREAGVLDALPALAVGAGTLALARGRAALLGPLVEADVDDDLGLQRLLHRAGDLWAALGPLALLVLPALTIGALALAIVGLVLIERLVARGDEPSVACVGCGRPIHPCAPACPACKTPAAAPRAVGLLGRPLGGPADREKLPFDLVAVRRCPACATRLGRRAVRQECGACGHRLMDDPAFARAYIAAIDRRVPLACGAGFVLGLVPILGVIPGVIAYRLLIVAPFRRYIPAGRGLLIRWGVRLASIALVGLQWVPVAGGLALPALGLISYLAYRAAYRDLALPGGDEPPAEGRSRAEG